MAAPHQWDAEGDMFGIRCKITFFDESANQVDGIAQRIVPFMDASKLKYICGEKDPKVFHFGQVSAEPDVLFELGDGYLCIEYKSRAGSKNPNIPRTNWKSALRLKEMLQVIIASRCVAANSGLVTASAIRYNNAFVLLVPTAALVNTVMGYVRFVPQEVWYRGTVASAKLAGFAEVYVKEVNNKDNRRQETEAEKNGRKAHKDMLNADSRTRLHQEEDSDDMHFSTTDINPSTGLLMMDGIGSVDVGGHTYGSGSMFEND